MKTWFSVCFFYELLSDGQVPEQHAKVLTETIILNAMDEVTRSVILLQ